MIGWLLPEMGRAGTTVSAFTILAAAGGPCYQAHLDAHVLSLMLIIFFKAYSYFVLKVDAGANVAVIKLCSL